MRNNYGAIQSLIFLILFSIAPCKVIALNLHSFIFGIISLLSFLYFPFYRYRFSNNGDHDCWKSDNYMGSKTEKNHEHIYKTNTKN